MFWCVLRFDLLVLWLFAFDVDCLLIVCFWIDWIGFDCAGFNCLGCLLFLVGYCLLYCLLFATYVVSFNSMISLFHSIWCYY